MQTLAKALLYVTAAVFALIALAFAVDAFRANPRGAALFLAAAMVGALFGWWHYTHRADDPDAVDVPRGTHQVEDGQ